MRIYLSGPITGDIYAREKFAKAAAIIDNVIGMRAVNPFWNGLAADANWNEHMRRDIAMMLECQGVALLSGWKLSKGASLERHIAISVGIDVRELAEWLPSDVARNIARLCHGMLP